MHSTLINNEWIAGEGEELVSSTPDERRVLWQKTVSSAKQVEEAVESAQKAQPAWEKLRLSDRIDLVNRYAGLLKEKQDSFAEVISLETGKPRWEALGEVAAMINKVGISIRAQQERAGFHHNNRLTLSHHAHGVMAVFGPFNFPGHLPNGHIVPALLAGNTIVFKPSELTPWVAEDTLKIWQQAGLPAGVINLVQGGKSVGEALAGAKINGILFTGSCDTGNAIHRQLAGRPSILLALEMGGNNPLIVSQVKDLDIAAHTVLHSAFLSAGQRCTCTRRLILADPSATDALLERLIGLCDRIVLGNGEIDPFMGPVINRLTAEKLLRTQDMLIEAGAHPLKKMRPIDASKVYLSPGVIDVSEVPTPPDEEYFGPLLQVFRVSDFDEAMQFANATRFGLAAGLISDVPGEHGTFTQQIKAGVISINAPTAGASSSLPFGGIGASGNHRPSAYYAADYCAWPQALTYGEDSDIQTKDIDLTNVRGLR